jgi:hypothetical protein
MYPVYSARLFNENSPTPLIAFEGLCLLCVHCICTEAEQHVAHSYRLWAPNAVYDLENYYNVLYSESEIANNEMEIFEGRLKGHGIELSRRKQQLDSQFGEDRYQQRCWEHPYSSEEDEEDEEDGDE